MYLSRDEMHELTGCRWHADQIEQLIKQGVPHHVRKDGRPVVVRDELIAYRLQARQVDKVKPEFSKARRRD